MELGFYTEENNPISLSPTRSFSLWSKLKNHNFLCNQTTKKSQTTPGKNKLGFQGDQPKEYTAIRTPKFAFLHQILTELKRPKPDIKKIYTWRTQVSNSIERTQNKYKSKNESPKRVIRLSRRRETHSASTASKRDIVEEVAVRHGSQPMDQIQPWI